MKLIIFGGSGNVGAVLQRHFHKSVEITIVYRSMRNGSILWDGKTLGAWVESLDGSDVAINLAGRSVNCRHTAKNIQELIDSRVYSTRIIGEAISRCTQPPKIWLQASTATIYSHRFDSPNDEETGIIGGNEMDAPKKSSIGIDIAKAWERELNNSITPSTRKVAMRISLIMSNDKGSIFDTLCILAKRGIGGRIGNGKQYVSWIHETDFCNAIDFLIANAEIEGAVNMCAPNPLPNSEFQRIIRKALGVRFGLPAPGFLLEIGAIVLRTESELLLKSRRVIPKRLIDAGFLFSYPKWEAAIEELVSHRK